MDNQCIGKAYAQPTNHDDRNWQSLWRRPAACLASQCQSQHQEGGAVSHGYKTDDRGEPG